MSRTKQIRPNEKLTLKLTRAERTLLLETCLPSEYERAIRHPTDPIMRTLDELDELGGYIAAEANHATDKKLQKKLDAVFDKVQHLLETHTDEAPPKTLKIEDAKKNILLSEQAVQIAEWAAKALIAAGQLGIKNKPVEHLSLAPAQRDVLLLVPGVSKAIKNKLVKEKPSFTVAEVASMTMALAEDLPEGEAPKQLAVMLVAKHLIDRFQESIVGPAKPKARNSRPKSSKTSAKTFLQFKITLLEIHPPIWRRIQVADCSLDKLHEHIQTAMGWTNSHLHHFKINDRRFGDPLLMEENFESMGYQDSTTTMLSDIVPKDGKRFQFEYEYDFGDSWEHEVLFEGFVPIEPVKRYSLCLEGARACPPEDVGGIGGYEEFLQAVADPEHERHQEFREWAGGSFDAEAFDSVSATKEMKKGLPDWRSEIP